MMVTFVSQCEKKALARTRRVLDAFADRIGDNTWQTLITDDGLLAAKRLLRKTVTKNTAVSCHWIRGRSRSELMWIVGNRNKFDAQGRVPVNYTEKDVFMDVMPLKPESGMLYANTKLQILEEHLFAVAYVGYALFKKLDSQQVNNQILRGIFIAGCLHDLGKIDPQFQAWVVKDKNKNFMPEDGQHIDEKKFSFDNHPRHNEISLMLIHFFNRFDAKKLSVPIKSHIEHAVYWHHAKPFRKEETFKYLFNVYHVLKKNSTKDQFSQLFDTSLKLLKQLDVLIDGYQVEQLKFSDLLDWKLFDDQHEIFESFTRQKPFPVFKSYDELDTSLADIQSKIDQNAINNIFRACVISADRLVSALDARELSERVKTQRLDELVEDALPDGSSLISHIEMALGKFSPSERSQKQAHAAFELLNAPDIAVLAGAAGCGKTKIALEWAKLKKAKKIIWVCPRVQICQGLFSELSQEYLPDAHVEIFTGELKFINGDEKPTDPENYFSGDIVVTTIDQVLGAVTTHTNVDGLLDFMDAHVVFDEYHEYVNMAGFNLLFAELVACKKLKGSDANTLLVSATPHYFYLKEMLGVLADDVVIMQSFNECDYFIAFNEIDENVKDESNPLFIPQSNSTFVISNTAQTAQLSFMKNQGLENNILLHSKFKQKDKQIWFDEVYDSFKKDGTGKYSVLRSGPIVQASLNISCDYMVTEITMAENMLQRIGRLDRFGNNKSAVNRLTVVITEAVKSGKCTDSMARFLNNMHSLQSTYVWYNFLSDKQANKPFKLSQLYNWYLEFYQLDSANLAIQSDFLKALKKSIDLLKNKVSEPTTIPRKKEFENRAVKISKNSLRGDNRFVQLAKIDVNNYLAPKFMNEYAYVLPLSDKDDYDNLTESLERIRNYDLVNHMAHKHMTIDPATPIKGIPANKMSLRLGILESYAKSPDFPIYLSYSENDLALIGGETARHSEAIYYAVCDKQPIGAISLKQIRLLNNGNHKESKS